MNEWTPFTCAPNGDQFPSCVIMYRPPAVEGGDFVVLGVDHVVRGVDGHQERRSGPCPVHAGNSQLLRPFRNIQDVADSNPVAERNFQATRVRKAIVQVYPDLSQDARFGFYLPDGRFQVDLPTLPAVKKVALRVLLGKLQTPNVIVL